MKHLLSTLFFLIVSTSVVIGQQAVVTGKVFDNSTGETLPGVNIFVDEGAGTITNLDGSYSIELAPGSHELIFRFVGFQEQGIAV